MFPDVSVIVLGILKYVDSKTIVSAPVDALAATIACRNDPDPESFVFVTVNTAGEMRVSSARTNGWM